MKNIILAVKYNPSISMVIYMMIITILFSWAGAFPISVDLIFIAMGLGILRGLDAIVTILKLRE